MKEVKPVLVFIKAGGLLRVTIDSPPQPIITFNFSFLKNITLRPPRSELVTRNPFNSVPKPEDKYQLMAVEL